jgi:hypothetical protein
MVGKYTSELGHFGRSLTYAELRVSYNAKPDRFFTYGSEKPVRFIRTAFI